MSCRRAKLAPSSAFPKLRSAPAACAPAACCARNCRSVWRHTMHPDLDDVLESALAEYSRVEPAPAAVRRWQAVPEPAAAPAIRRMWPVWTAALAALLLALALLWMGGSMRGPTSPRRTPAIPQPALAQEKMVLVPANPNHS